EVVLVAILRDRDPVNEIHDEVGPSGARRTGIEYAGDVFVVHESQRLALSLETRGDLPGVHPGLDQLERNNSLDRLLLPRHPDRVHAALADFLQERIGSDDGARGFGRRLAYFGFIVFKRGYAGCGTGLAVGFQQLVYLPAQLVVVAGLIQED